MNTSTNSTIILVNALRDAGILKSIMGAPLQQPDSYKFGDDNKTDARLIPGILRTMYTAVGAAKLRLMNVEVPAFDLGADGEDTPETTAQPEAPLSYEALQRYASAGYRKALSMGRHEDARWLLSMNRTYVEKDDEGRDVAKIGTVHVVVPFTQWLQREIEETDPVASPNWYAFLLLVKQQGADVPVWEDGVNEADVVFNEWLDMVPWTRNDDQRTHREKAVSKSADSKWKALVNAAKLGNGKEITKILDSWNIMVYSPLMARDVKSIEADAEYQLMLVDEAVTKQEQQLALLEHTQYLHDLKAKIAERQAALDARFAKLLGEQKPEKPSQPNVTPLARPNVINSR